MQKKLTAQDKQQAKAAYDDLIQARKETKMNSSLNSKESFGWLNENSRKFLAAGYLGDGVSPEQRIADIANAG